MKMKKLAALGLAAIMTLSMAACGGGDSGESSDGGSSDSSASSESSGELTVWLEKIFSDDANAAIEERINSFAEEKGVTVNVEFIAATDFTTKLNAAVEAGNNVPDVVTSAVTKIVNYYPSNPFLDVTDLVEEISGERPYLESIIEGSKIEDKNYFVPMTSSSTMAFIRKDKMEEAGVTEVPATWDELFDAAEKMSDPDNGFYGLGMGCGPTDEDGENIFRMMMWNEGGYVFDADGNITLDSDAVKDLLNKYKEMYDNGVVPPAASTWDSGGNNTSYLMGECGIVFNAPTLYNAMATDESYAELLENTEVVNLPAGSDNNVTMGFAAGPAIMKDSKNVDQAKELIKYLFDKEWYDEYLEITAPVYSPVFEDCKEIDTWTDGVNAQVLGYAENSKGYYGYPVESTRGRALAAKSYFTFPMAKMLNQVVTGAEDADSAVEKAVKDLEELDSTVQDQ